MLIGTLDAMRAGAQGYLLKGANQDGIARALAVVAAGEMVFGRRSVVGSRRTSPGSEQAAPPAGARSRG